MHTFLRQKTKLNVAYFTKMKRYKKIFWCVLQFHKKYVIINIMKNDDEQKDKEQKVLERREILWSFTATRNSQY